MSTPSRQLVKYEMLGLAAKYGLGDLREGLSVIGDSVLGKLFTPIVPLFTKQQNW